MPDKDDQIMSYKPAPSNERTTAVEHPVEQSHHSQRTQNCTENTAITRLARVRAIVRHHNSEGSQRVAEWESRVSGVCSMYALVCGHHLLWMIWSRNT